MKMPSREEFEKLNREELEKISREHLMKRVSLSDEELEEASGGWIDPYQECMDKTYDDVYKCVDEFSVNPYGGGSLQACYQAMYDAQDACNSLR